MDMATHVACVLQSLPPHPRDPALNPPPNPQSYEKVLPEGSCIIAAIFYSLHLWSEILNLI